MRRASGVERLAVLYQLVETNRSIELRTAASGLREVEEATAREILVHQEQVRRGRFALFAGEPEALLIASTEERAAERRSELLFLLKQERQQRCSEARDTYRLARLQHEQMQLLATDAKSSLLLREARQAQASSDDRFASRRDWVRSEDVKRSQMSVD